MSVPLQLRDQVIGLLVLDSTEVEHFTEHSADLASAFADQVAIALENARLVSKRCMQPVEARCCTRLTSNLNASLDLERVYQAVGARHPASALSCRATHLSLPC